MGTINMCEKGTGKRYTLDMRGASGFRFGDIVTSDDPHDLAWYQKRVFINGALNQNIAGTLEGESEFSLATSERLILLQRPKLLFKVGDRVRHATKGIGTVIVLAPMDAEANPYLIGFDTFQNGHAAIKDWSRSWYPNIQKRPGTSCWWCEEGELEPVALPTTATGNSTPVAEEELVQTAGNVSVTVDTTVRRHGFRAGDEIWIPRMHSLTDSTPVGYYTIVGAEKNLPTKMLARDHVDSDIYYLGMLEADTLNDEVVLLARSGALFRAGDKVTINCATGKYSGTIVALNPCAEDQPEYLILPSLESRTSGRTAAVYKDKFWFPDTHRLHADMMTACFESEIDAPNKPVLRKKRRARSEPIPPACRAILRETHIRLQKDELPVFDPLKFNLIDGKIVDFGEISTAKNKRECLRLLGVALFHMLNDESEWNDLKYEAEPEASYRRLIPANEAGDIVKFLLFDDTNDEATLKEILAPAEEMPEQITVNAIMDDAKTEPDRYAASALCSIAMKHLVAAGLTDDLAQKVAGNDDLAQKIIQLIREFPGQ